MATEIDIPVSVSSKKGEGEDDAFSSEFSEGKVAEHPGNKVKQLESEPNQPLETSSHVAETVNTQLESDKRIDEGGIFFQALSVPVVTADEHINTPESCETTTTEDQEDRWTAKIETVTEGKPNDDERVATIASKDTEDHNVVEAISAQTKGSIDHVLGLIKDSDKEEVTEFSNKEGDLQGKNYNNEVKEPEIVKTKEEVEEDNEEIRQSENGARDKSEQKPVESVDKLSSSSETEQEEQSEVIRPIVEIDEKMEQKALEKVESEKEVKLSDSSSMKLEEKAITTLNEDDDHEKEQEVNMSAKSQGKDNITSSQDVTFGGLQRKNHYSESSEPELVETKEIIEKDTREIEYNVVPTDVCISTQTEPEEKTPKNEEKNEEDVIGSDDSLMVKELCEEVVSKKVESEEVSNLPDNASMVLNENAIVSKKDQDKLQVSGKGQGGGEDVTSSQNASSEYIKETKTGQHATTPAYFKEGQELNVTPNDILEKGDDKTIDPQEESEQCKNEAKDKREQKQEESVNKIVPSSLKIEQEVDTEEIKPSDKKQEQQGLLHVITADASNSTQTKSHVESEENDKEETIESDDGQTKKLTTQSKPEEETTEENEEKNEEANECDDGQTNKSRSPMVEVCKETVPENANEYEGLIHSDTSSTVLNENDIVSKGEYQEKGQEFYVSEKGQHGGDDVTSSRNASSEDIKEMIGEHDTKVAYFEEVQGLNAVAKDILKEDAIVPREANEQYENGAHDKKEQKPEESIHSCLEIEQEECAKEIKPDVEKELKEEQEGQMHISTQTETQVESRLEATEHEEKNEHKENEQEVGMLEENQGEEEASSKMDLEGKNYDGEHIELELVENGESIKEDIEDIRTNVETEKIKEQQGSLSAIVTDVCKSAQIESKEDTTKSEESIESHDDQKEKLVIPGANEGCEETGLNFVESIEEVQPFDSSSMKQKDKDQEVNMLAKGQGNDNVTSSQDAASEEDLQEKDCHKGDDESEFVKTRQTIEKDIEEIGLNENEVANTDEDQEKEQELKMSEEVQGGGDEVISSQNGKNEDIIETTINQESQCETNKEIESKLDAQNQDNGREDRSEKNDEVVLTEKMPSELGQPKEQNVEEIQACQTTAMSEIIDDQIAEKDDDLSLGSKKDTDDDTIKEEKNFLDGKTREIETSTLENEPVEEKTTIKLEEITKKDFQESQTETNVEIECKLDAENQADVREDRSEMKDGVIVTEKMSSELGQPMEQNVEEIQACQTTAMSEKLEEQIAEKDEDLSLGSIEDTNDNTVKEEKSFLDGRTREIEISALENEPAEEKTIINSEEITKQAFQENQTETNNEIEGKLDDENQADEREDKSDMKDEVIVTEKMSSELGQPMEQNVEKIQACQTTAMSEKIEEQIAKKDEDLSLGSKKDTDDDAIKEEKSFLDERTREIETSTLENEPVGEKTTLKPKEITKIDFQESQTERNKEIEGKLDAKNQDDGREDRSDMIDEVVLIEKISSEVEKPMEHVEEIQACPTTAMSEKIEEGIAENDEDLSLGSKKDTDDDTIKEEKSFLDGRTREIEISALEHEHFAENTTMKPEKITKQAFQESQTEINKKQEAKLDAENQANNRSEMKDEAGMTEKVSSELGQLEQNVEEIQECQTMSEKTEDEITEKNEDLSLGSKESTDDDTIKEEKSFLDGETREVEISALEHEPVGEKTTMEPEKITKQDFEESQSETNKEMEPQLDAENQVDGREVRNEMKDEVVLTEKVSSELGQPMEQNVEEIQSCQTTTMGEKTEEEITEKNEDLSLGGIEDTNDDTIKEEKSFLDGRTREIEICALEHEPVDEKTTMEPEEITNQDFEEIQSERNKEQEAKLDIENQANYSSEMNDEVSMTEKISSELGQLEQNVDEIQECQTTAMSEKIEDEIAEKDEDLSHGSKEDTNDNIFKEEKNFLDGRTREIEILALEHEPVGEKTTMEPKEITKLIFQESKSEANKDMELKLDAENQDGEREDGSEMKDEVVLTEKMSSELEKPMEQNVEEIQASCRTITMSENIEDEIVEKDDDTIKEEKKNLDGRTREIETSTLENEPVGEKTTLKPEEITKIDFQESQTETNKEIEGKLDAENQADGTEDSSEMKDEIILTEKMSSELEQPTEQNVEEIQACRTITMSEKIEDEIAEKDEESLGSKKDMDDDTTKEEKTFLDGTREIEISALEHEPVGEKTTMEPEMITKQNFEESQSETNKELEPKLDAENQADGREDRSGIKDGVALTEKMSSELGQPMEQNFEEIQACQTTTMSEKTEEIAEKDEDLSHGSIDDTNDDTTKEEKSFLDGRTREIVISTLEHEHVEEKNGGLDEISKKKCIDLNETTSVELQEDFIPSGSPGTSTEDTPNSENSKAESENLPIEDLDSVSEVQIPRVVPTSEDSNLKEECLISATATSIDEERETVTKEISNDEIAYSDPIPVENPEVTEVRVDAQIGQEDLQAAKDINCESKTSSSIQALKTDLKEGAEKSARIGGEAKNDGVDEAPKQERISTLEDAATVELQIDQSNIESTYPLESDKSPTQALESVIDVQTPEVVADSEESKEKEECVVLATAEHTDENNGEEEQEIKTNEISSAETAESKQVIEHPSMTCPDAVLIEENLKLYGELKPTSELMIDEDQVNETKPQPEQSDITSENIMKYQTLESKLEQTSEKDLNRSWDMKEDVTLEPENQINSTEDQNETIKNVIFKENVVVETEKEEGKTEVKGQDSEKDNCPKELEKTSTSNKKELANEIEYSESIPTENTEVAEVKAESQREEAPNHEFEKEEKNDGLISEIPTPEAILEMETKEEHLEATNDSCETLTGGLSSEKLLGELKEIDAKEDTEIIVRGEEKAAEDSYQDAVAEVTAISQKEEKLVSMVPHEELTSPTAEDQTNELVTETDNTKVEYNIISKKDRNPEEFTETLTEDQRSVKKKHIEEEGQGNFGVENMEAKSGNEAMEDVLVNEVLLEVEKAKESKSIKDNINEEASCVPNQLASATYEVCQIKRLNSSPNELLEAKDLVEDIGDPNLTPENLNLKAEKIIEADANKEKETLNEQIDDPAKTTSDSISSSTEQDKEVRSEKSSGHGDMHKLEEKPTEVCELTSEVDETVAEGKEVSTLLTENLPEASPEMLLVKHDLETTTIQGVDKRFEEAPAIDDQKHENDLDYTAVDETVAEGKEVSTMLTENLPEASPEMLLVKHDLETTTMQGVDKRFEEAPAVDDQKHENDLDYTAIARTIDVVSKTESPEIEQQHLDKKEASVGPINQENQSDQKKEADEKIQSDIPIEKVPKQTTAHKEIADEFLVMPVAKEEEKLNCLQDYSKEEEHCGKRTYQDPEAVTEPSQTDKLSDKVKKAEPIDIQEETMAEGNLHEEETEKRTNITEATVEKGDATLEYVKSSDVDLKGDMDAPVPKCVSTRNPEVRSAILEVLSGMDTTAVKAGYNKDPNDKTSEAHVAEKEVLKEDIHHDFGTNQEPFNLPLTKKGSMELDAPVMPGTAATEDVEISQKHVTDDLIKTSQIQPEQQKKEVSACDVDKQLPDKPYQNESMESKLLTGNIDGSHEQGEPTTKSLNANTKDLKPTIASSTEPQCSSEVVKEEKKISDEKEKSETAETATIFNDILHESTKGNSEVAENLIDDREPAPKNDQQVDQEETGDNRAKTDEEDEAEEDDEDNEKMGSGSDALVMIEAPKDMEVKVHKKSHNILSGVGSKVKHSIAKVKKAITGKSSHPKPPSPKERD